MPIAKVQLSDGRIAKIEVPEGTSEQDVMEYVKALESQQSLGRLSNMKTEIGGRPRTQDAMQKERQALINQINANLSGFDKFLIGTGRGFTNVARGLGVAEQEDEITKQAFKQLAADSWAAQGGEILGEAAAFLAAAPLFGAGLTARAGASLIPAARTAAGRILGTGALGATEGAVLAGGRGGDATDRAIAGVGAGVLAGTIEAITPGIVRMGGALFRRLGRTPKGNLLKPDGTPTPEFQQVLDQTGTSFDDLAKKALDDVNSPNVNPEQASRSARFESLDIPATRGDISQDFAQQATEQRLLNQAFNESGEPLRQLKKEQSNKFVDKVSELVDSLGVPDDAGRNIKDALSGRKELLRSEKNALYKTVAESSPELSRLPIVTDDIIKALPSKDTLDDLAITSQPSVEQVKLALARFGIDQSDEAIELLARRNIEPEQLNMANFERFRKTLNNIDRADQTGASKVMTGPLRAALDAEAELIDNAVKNVAGVDESMLNVLKQARQRVNTIKTEFSPQSIVGKLIDVKRDGVSEVIEASAATRKLLSQNAPIEDLEKVLFSLKKSGKQGRRAIKDLQASAVLNALENALKAPSNKTSGTQVISADQFVKSLNKLGDKKLDLLFRGSPKALNRLRNLKQTATDITPTAASMPKGSAAVILDIISRTGNLPGLAAVRDVAKFLVNAGADDRAVRRALNSRPAVKKAADGLSSDFPLLASTLGISTIASTQSSEDQ